MVNEELCKCKDCGQIQDASMRFACKNCKSNRLGELNE